MASSTRLAQRVKDEPQVDVGMVELGRGEMHPQERHVELAAVEGDQQRKLRDVGRELVKVDALDEQGQLAAAYAPMVVTLS